MEGDKTIAGTVIGGTAGFLLFGAALLPVAMPAVIAAGIAALGMIGGAAAGGTVAACMEEKDHESRHDGQDHR